MDTIESTPEMASRVYATLARNIESRAAATGAAAHACPKNCCSDISMIRSIRSSNLARAIVQLRPDRVVLQDVLGQTAMLQFMQTRRDRVAVPTSIHCDHLIQARVEGAADFERVARREPRNL